MPRRRLRRAIGGAFEGAGQGLQSYFNFIAQQAMSKEEQKRALQKQLFTTLASQVAPEDLQEALPIIQMALEGGDFTGAIGKLPIRKPTPEARIAPMLEEIQGITDPAQAVGLTEETLGARALGAGVRPVTPGRIPMRGPGGMQISMGPEPEASLPDIRALQSLISAGEQKRAALGPPGEWKRGMTPEGGEEDKFIPFSQRAGTSVTSALSPQAQTDLNLQVAKSPAAQELFAIGTEQAATRGGTVAGAEAQARWNVEWSPQAMRARLNEHVNKTVEALKASMPYEIQQGNIEFANKAKNESSQKAAALAPRIYEIRQLWEATNPVEQQTVQDAMKRSVQAGPLVKLNPRMEAFMKSIETQTAALARFGGDVGNIALSEREFSKAFLPLPTDSREMGNAKLMQLEALLMAGPIIQFRVTMGEDPITVSQDELKKAYESLGGNWDTFGKLGQATVPIFRQRGTSVGEKIAPPLATPQGRAISGAMVTPGGRPFSIVR